MAITSGSFASDFNRGLGELGMSAGGGDQTPTAPQEKPGQPLAQDAMDYPGNRT